MVLFGQDRDKFVLLFMLYDAYIETDIWCKIEVKFIALSG